MNGDEDLGQDIIMKGEKFHYTQQNLVQLNGDEGGAEGGATGGKAPAPEKQTGWDPIVA
jgi:hypothetical protein